MTNHADPFAHLHSEDYHRAYSAPLLTHEGLFFHRHRSEQSLNGTWYCSLDKYDEGLRQKWFAEKEDDPKKWVLPPDYSVAGGKAVTVPQCISNYDATWDLYEGAMWFTRDFDFIPSAGERTFLRVGAAANEARVFLNGEFLGRHLGASTPFCVELKNIQAGKNRLQIQVDNTRRAEHVPMNHTDWFNYGGIYRDVSLVNLPRHFIRDFYIGLLPNDEYDCLHAEIALSDAIDGQARLVIPELGVTQMIQIRQGKGEITINTKPALWRPENPRLYSVSLCFGNDLVTDRVGFRQIRVEGERILLNGKDVWLRGISVHEEYPALGKAANEGVIRDMLAHVRELGCNFIRLAHYPHHEKVAQLADELGILLWEEIPVYWAIAFGSKETQQDATNQLSELIKRDRNRASVIIWGVGNENADTDARYHFMSQLAKTAKRLDPSRLTSAACLINRAKFTIEDRLAAELDIIGVNEYFGWYEPEIENLSRLLAQSAPGKPVIITETGADALLGHRGETRELFTEDCQVEIYKQQTTRLNQASYIRGMTPWILYDFRTERRQNPFQQGYNLKGLIARDHQSKKLSFTVLADFYAQKKRESEC